MTEPVRLYIATDDPEGAPRALLGMARHNLPAWIEVVTDASVIDSLPAGARVATCFRRKNSAIELAWSGRPGEFAGLTPEFLDQWNIWMGKREAAFKQLVDEAIADDKAKQAQQAEEGKAA